LAAHALGKLEPDGEIFALLENQPEHVATPWGYMNRLVSEKRIAGGREKLAEHGDLLAAIEQRFGVDRHVVLAIWGVESGYGASTGSRSVVRSLATLAAGDPRRPQFWRAELLTALSILHRGDIKLDRMTGSWAGAMGHTQFMPSSYMTHAVDFDGDGRRDIWTSIPDALASTANYLKAAGWMSGTAWGQEVVLPAGFDMALTAPGIARSRAEWEALGVTPPAGQAWKGFDSASIVLPAGARGPVFLVSPSFRAILRYNNATPYALAVGHLADRLSGGAPIAGIWPIDDPPLARSSREELQRRLASLGYEVGAPDGVIGQQTKLAIRTFQTRAGLPEDGYAGENLLEAVRQVQGP
jgi:membrane-bound lytic murein transglycosylase B